MNPLEVHVLNARDAGLSVIPIKDDEKRPAIDWKPYQQRIATVDEVRTWLRRDGRNRFGIVCGAVSGHVEALDVEGRAVKMGVLDVVAGAMADHAADELWQRINSGYVQTTPSGGMHLLYRVEGGAPGSEKLASAPIWDDDKGAYVRQVLIETRGEGGQVVAAPSPGYHVARGDYDTLPVISAQEHQLLHGIIRRFANVPDDEPERPTLTATSTDREGDRPGDHYNADPDAPQHTLDLLLAHGWQIAFWAGDTAHLVRPDKRVTDGTSATINHVAPGVLYVFSTNALPFDAGRAYDPFGVYTLLEHGGDFVAASAALREQGYGDDSPLPGLVLLDEWPNHVTISDTTTDTTSATTDDPDHDPWGLLDWSELFSDDALSEPDWIVDHFVEAGRGYSLYSPAGQGKSLLTLELGVCVSQGRPVFGRNVPRPRTVVYIDKENTPRDLRERLEAMGYDAASLTNLRYLSFPIHPPLDTDAGGQALVDKVVALGGELVVLDTFSRMVDGDENEADTYRKFYDSVGWRLKAHGIALWRLDHAGKDVTRGQRGSSAKNDDVDVIYKLKVTPMKGGDAVELKREKARSWHGEDDTVRLVRVRDPLTHVPREWVDPVERLAGEMDAAGVPVDVGANTLRKAKAEGGYGYSAKQNHLVDAQKLRRERTEGSAQHGI